MLKRWNSITENINIFVQLVKRLVRKTFPNWKKKGRGRPPKHDPEGYLTLLATKEFYKKSLRGEEVRLSELTCNARVDHSVIAYWENKPEVTSAITKIISLAGAMLEKALSSLFLVVDATRFSSWYIDETEIHLCNKVANGTVYPIGISFKKGTIAAPVDEAVPNGVGTAYLDAGYDDNKTIGLLFEKGYTPIVSPNKNRWRGHWRKKARKLYRMPKNRLGYRQRGRGESIFGSLTNCYGDRLDAINTTVMQTRIALRILAYQVKLLIRVTQELLGIVRHAHALVNFIYSLNS